MFDQNVRAGIEESARREPGTPLPLPLRREQHWEAHHAQPHRPCHRWEPSEYRIRVTFGRIRYRYLDSYPDTAFPIAKLNFYLLMWNNLKIVGISSQNSCLDYGIFTARLNRTTFVSWKNSYRYVHYACLSLLHLFTDLHSCSCGGRFLNPRFSFFYRGAGMSLPICSLKYTKLPRVKREAHHAKPHRSCHRWEPSFHLAAPLLRVLTNEKRGEFYLESFDWSRCKLFTLKFSRESVQNYPVKGLKLLIEPCFCLKTISVFLITA